MNYNIADIRRFYQSRLGRVAARFVNKKIQKLWPDIHDNQVVVGFGYATPYLSINQPNRANYIAAMPMSQGVIRWPWRGPNQTIMCEDYALPFDDQSIDYIILSHIVEHNDDIHALLKEVWRVLKGSGRLLVLVPNRTGLWSRADNTPFGHGQPYSNRQIYQVLKEQQFIPRITKYSLFFPPLDQRFTLSMARIFEWMGPKFFPQLGGIALIEASKQLYCMTPHAKKSARRIMPSPIHKTTAGQARISSENP